jgi:hypothetical protein
MISQQTKRDVSGKPKKIFKEMNSGKTSPAQGCQIFLYLIYQNGKHVIGKMPRNITNGY